MQIGAYLILLLALILGIFASGGCAHLTGQNDYVPDQPAEMTVRGQGSATRNSAPGSGSRNSLADDLDPSSAGKTFRKYTGRGPNREVAQRAYVEGDQAFRDAAANRQAGKQAKSKFLKAAQRFKVSAERWPDSALEQDGLFMAAESYFFADHYTDANKQYQLLIKKYPNTRHLDTVGVRTFVIAEHWLDLAEKLPSYSQVFNFSNKTRPKSDTRGNAVRILDKMRLDDPTGRLADDATMLAGNAFFRRERYLDARDRYEDLIRTFPQSEHQFEAHLLALKSSLESYRGPSYDADPLDAAEKLLKKIRKQFPRESDEHREYLMRTFADIRHRQAERDWFYAKYYDRRGEYGAARYYYDNILSKFGETSFAQRANERVAQIQDRAPVPPDRFRWLTAFFPVQEDVKPIFQGGSGGSLLR